MANTTITQQKIGFTAAGNASKLFTDMTQGLYIRGLPTTTLAGVSIPTFTSETTAQSQQIFIEQNNGSVSSFICM